MKKGVMMKAFKRMISMVLIICLFSTDPLTLIAQAMEYDIHEKKEVFEYPKANVYSKAKEKEEEQQKSFDTVEQGQEKEETNEDELEIKETLTKTDLEKESEEQQEVEETKEQQKEQIEQEEKQKVQEEEEVNTSKIEEQKEDTDKEKEEKTETTFESDYEKEEKAKDSESLIETEEELTYPIIEEEEEDEFEVLYGEPIEVTQYTKVYKTSESTYKTVYSDIPNTYVDESGEEKEIDNTLEPIIEEKEVEKKESEEEQLQEEDTDSTKESMQSILSDIPNSQMNSLKVAPLDKQESVDNARKTQNSQEINQGEEKQEEKKEIQESKTEKVVTAYTNVSNDMEVTLPGKESESNGVTLTKNNFSITLQPMDGDYTKAAVKENAILYNEVYDNIDIQYTVDTFGMKEDIILNEKTDKNKYIYHLSREGVEAKLIDNVVYLFKEGENKPSMVLSAPLMKDTAEVVSKDITLTLEEKEDDYVITMQADEEWLNSEERVYPIYIDPSIDTIDEDIVIYSICSDSDFLSSTTGYVGYSEDYGKSRSYVIIGYPFTGLLPDNAVVTNAKLNLYQYAGNEKGKITCYRLEEALNHDEGIAGMTWASSVSINREVAGKKSNFKSKIGKHEIDITDTVSRWVEGIAPVHGLVLIADSETKTNAEFYTYESSGVSKSKKPKIVVDWKYEGELDENAYTLNDTSINLRTLIEANINGKHFFHGVYADGEAKPGAAVHYELNDTSKGFDATVQADFFKIFPDSSVTNKVFPSGTTKYKDKLSNWQTPLPFVDFKFNVLYQISATASKDGETGKKVDSEKFLIYKVTQFDTLPKIAKYYGVPLNQMLFDNKAGDMLVVKNNTLFIRNPKKNAKKPYNPPKLDDDAKAQIDSLLMGRGLHCEFGFEPINLNTGNFFMEQTDASIADENKDFAITRNYNAKGASRNSYFGRGWQTEYEEQVSFDENLNVIYSRGDGSSLVFTKNGEGYTSPQGYDYTLEKKVVDTRTINMGKKEKEYKVYEYTITDHKKTKRIFNEYGYLTQIIDNQGNRIDIAYDDNYFIKQISSSTGFTYQITCNENGNITAIRLPSGETLSYTYDDKENLISYTNELGITLRYVYDENHRMTQWYDGNGQKVIQNVYDGEDRITKQIDANGKESTLSYEQGKTVTRDGNGDVTVYYYDDQYRTTQISYPNGTSIKRTYQNNQMVLETDTLGHTTTYEYDNRGNVTREIRYDGASRVYAYNNQNMVISQTDYEGKQVRYEYNEKGSLTKVIQPENRTIVYTYDNNNHLTGIKDAKGNQSTFTYQGPWISSMTDANGQVQKLSYNSKGDITSITDKAGNIIRYEYDSARRRIKETNAIGKSTSYIYDNAGNITAITDGKGAKTTFTHDGNGNILSLKDPMGRMYYYEYDALGNKIKFTDPKGLSISYHYDSMGNNTSITNGEGKTFYYEYDALGNKIREIEANGNATSYTYDYRINQIKDITDSIGGKTSFSYNANGLILGQTDSNGGKTQYSYDAADRLKQVIQENGLSVNYTYDQNDNITQMLYSDGKKYTFVYDKLNHLMRAALPNEATLSYTYDVIGNLTNSVDELGNITTYEHDAIGNLTAKIDANGNSTEYGYDGNNNLTQTIDPLGNITKNIYDSMDKLIKKVDASNYVTEYNYDDSGNLSSIIDALNGKTTYQFDQRGLVTQVTDAGGNAYQLSYDNNGNNIEIVTPDKTSVTNSYDSRNLLIKSKDSQGLETTYQYDGLGQLISEENNAGDSTKYTYDVMGNVTSITNSMGQKTTYTYDLSSNLVKVQNWDQNVTQYEYDKMGNVIKITDPEGKVSTYQYDKANRLISKSDDAMRVYQYTYDKLGNLTSATNPLGETDNYAYDVLGNLVAITDTAGKKESFSYDKTGNQIAQVDKNGNKTEYTYDALGQVIGTLNANGAKEQYLYDALGNLTKYQDALGNVTNYHYDNMGELSKLVTPNGGEYVYSYDGYGNNTSIINPLGAKTEIEYDKKGQVTKRVLSNSAQYSYSYDPLGRLTKVEAPENISKQYEYNEVGDLIQEIDQADRSVSYTYDKQHRLLTTTNEEDATTSYTYDARGNLSTVITPLGGTSTYTYDILDRVESLTDPVGKLTELTYDIQGNLTSIIENGGRSTQYGYDAVGNQIYTTNAKNETVKYEYDKVNQLTTIIDQANQKTVYGYDMVGQLTSITDAKGKSLNLTYDANGNMIQAKDEEDRTTSYTYDLADQLVRVTDGDNIDTVYTYDTIGNLTGITDGNQNTTTYTYDLLGRMTSMTNPLSQVQEFVYDVEGRLSQTKQPDGSKIQYDYNKIDQLLSVDYGKEKEEEKQFYAYDKEGRRISMSDVSGTTSYEYDEAGRVTTVKTSDEKEILYTYDSYGNLAQLTYPDGKKVIYTYDELDRLSVLTDRDNKETHYTYDEKGNLVQIKRPNKTTTNLKYDVLNQVNSIENLNANKKVISKYRYTYDNSGYITTEEQDSYFGKEKIQSKSRFSYDLRGQLTQVVKTENGKESQIRYTYDKAGNRISIEKSEDTAKKQLIENHYDEANRLITSVDSLIGETTFEYDENGNRIKELAPGEEVVEYSYDVENRLNSVKEQGTLLMAALYDGDGNRIFKIEKTKTSYDETIEKHGDFIQGEQSIQKPVEWDTYQSWTNWDYVTEWVKNTFTRTDITTNKINTKRTKTTTTTQTTTTTDSKESYKEYAPDTQIEESKVYLDSTDHFFWYGFGQGMLQGFSTAPQYLSSWFHDAWDYISNEYYIVRHIKTIEYETPKEIESSSAYVENETDTKIEEQAETSEESKEPILSENSEKKVEVEKRYADTESTIPDDEPEGLSGYEKVLYDTVLIPNGTTEIERNNYKMTSYVNDVNQEYTQVLMEYDVNDEVASVYDYGVQRNSYENHTSGASQIQYYMYDGRGSVSDLTSKKGKSVVNYQYDAYGSAKVSGETYNPYQYNAEAVDDNTGLQYLRARYYSSENGGFLTQDTYLGIKADPLTQNLYTYTGNNPVNLVDPSGHNWFKDITKKVGGAIEKVVDKGIKIIKDIGNAIVDFATDVYEAGKDTINKGVNYIKDTFGGDSSKGKTSPASGGSGSSRNYSGGGGGGSRSDSLTTYLSNQVDDPIPVDPVTAGLQSRFGGADVTNVNSNYAYVDGKLFTALSYNEHKMCTDAKRIQKKGQDSSKGIDLPRIADGFINIITALGTGAAAVGTVVLLAGSAGVTLPLAGLGIGITIITGGSDFSEGVQDVVYGFSGDKNKKTINPIRDKIFGGNQEAYAAVEIIGGAALGVGAAGTVVKGGAKGATSQVGRASKDIAKKAKSASKTTGVGNPAKIEGKGITGRIVANNLEEQMAMHQVKSNPLEGATKLPIKLNDTRWPASQGWVKMQSIVKTTDGNKITIHFVYNEITGAFDDFKFK